MARATLNSAQTSHSVRADDQGLAIERRFTREGVHPFDELEWELRDALIGDPAKPAFEQRGVEFPKTWSQNATNIVAQKYFRGQLDQPERERSVKQMIGRVAGTISGWGRERGYCLQQTGLPLGVWAPWPRYLEELASSYFCVSPFGIGIDCVRTWEALLVRTIPVVRRSLVTDHHPGRRTSKVLMCHAIGRLFTTHRNVLPVSVGEVPSSLPGFERA